MDCNLKTGPKMCLPPFLISGIGVQNNIPSPLGEGQGEGNAGKCAPSPRSSPKGEDEVSSIDNFPPEADPPSFGGEAGAVFPPKADPPLAESTIL